MNNDTKAVMFRLAADRVDDESEWYSCNAITIAINDLNLEDPAGLFEEDIKHAYRDVFTAGHDPFWLRFLLPDEYDLLLEDNLQPLRVLMLCFAATLAESGDLESVSQSAW